MTSRRILVIRPDRIGDVIISLPVFESLRHKWPDAHLAAMVHPYTQDLLTHIPYIDEVITDDPPQANTGVMGFMEQVARLRESEFDTALMLLPTVRVSWMIFLAGISIRYGVGHTIYQNLTFTRTVSREKHRDQRHESDYCLDLARAIGVTRTDFKPRLHLEPEERSAATALLDSHGLAGGPIVGIHPGNGNNAPNWTPDQYACLARELHERIDCSLVITGGENERELAKRIVDDSGAPIASLAGQMDLRSLMAVIDRLDILVSSSTGPMHIAAALGTGTVSLFCPQPGRAPERWAPISDRACVLLPSEGPCPTCEQGPMCNLSGISTQAVVEAVIREIHQQTPNCPD